MTKKILVFLFTLALSAVQLSAQETIVISDTLVGWDYGWVAGLNGSQAAYSNWSQGGSNNIAVSGNSTIQAYFNDGRYSYGFLINTRYGKTRLEGQGTRKTDDRLSIRNRFIYDIGRESGDFSLFGNINFRTQFDEGYDYSGDEDLLISSFLSPAYFVQMAGLAYNPGDNFTFEAGLGMQQTIVQDDDLTTVYGLEEGENFRNEAGLNLGASYQHNIATNLVLSSNLETFTNVSRSLLSTDVNFSNEVVGKINDFLNASVRFDLVYDDDFSDEVQLRQGLSLGVSFILL